MPSNALLTVQRLPSPGASIQYAIGQTALGIWNTSVYTFDAEGRPTPNLTVTSDDPALMVHTLAALMSRYQWAATQNPPPGAQATDALGQPWTVPSAQSLIITKKGKTRPLAAFSAKRAPDSFMRSLWGLVNANARAGAQMAVKAAAGKMQHMGPEERAHYDKLVPAIFKVQAPNGAVAGLCGAHLTMDEPMLGRPCLNGGPCTLTKSKRCVRLSPVEELITVPGGVQQLLVPVPQPIPLIVEPEPAKQPAPKAKQPAPKAKAKQTKAAPAKAKSPSKPMAASLTPAPPPASLTPADAPIPVAVAVAVAVEPSAN